MRISDWSSDVCSSDLGFDIGALPVDGNIGLRYVRTDGEQTVLVEDENGDYQPLTGGKPYENWLPSANIRFQFTPDLFLRLAYSKAITRPDYGNLSPALLLRSEEHTSELQSLMRISYAVFFW